MNPQLILETYYTPGTLSHTILLRHSLKVAHKAREAALRATEPVDVRFVEEAALLHDIGILFTHAPEIGCHGDLPYLAHGYKGRELLEKAGFPRHALVCDRHIGVGLTAEEIRREKLPLPERDMIPLSIEEQIVAYADLFFSKNPRENDRERSPEEVRRSLGQFGLEKIKVFDFWHRSFGSDSLAP